MKKQVIFDITETLDDEKIKARKEAHKHKPGIHEAYNKGRCAGLEEAIRICLLKADILDMRPAYDRYIEQPRYE